MPVPDRFEFGPFHLDAAGRALYHDGEFVAVAPKALETLLVLVEDAGRVVSKDELLERVWPDAFVEEGSIANNISSLRKILNPHFEGEGPIATIAKRGYRFTAPVTIGNAVPEAAAVASFSATPTVRVVDAVRVATPLPAAAPDPRWRWSGWPVALAMTAALVVAAIAFGASIRGSRLFTPSAPVRRSVAVLSLKNLSGQAEHAWFSTALTETIGAELMAGAQFRLVSGENVLRMQRELELPTGVALTRKQLDAAGRDLGCDLILSGSFLAVGGKIRVDVRLDDVATGEPIASVSGADDEGNLLALVQRTGAELRSKMGVAQPGAVQADSVRASFASNPAAIRLYFEGLDALRMRDGPQATDLLTRAVASDANFALAHAALSSTWRVQGYERRAVEEAKRALDLSGPLSQEGRLAVEAQYHEVSLNWPRATELYRTLWASYPDNAEYGLKLGTVLQLANRFNDAPPVVEQLRKMPAPDSRDPRIDLLEATIAERLADFPRAQKAAAAAAEKARAARATLQLASTRIKQAVYAYRLGQHADMRMFLDEATQTFEAFGDLGNLADARRWSGVLFLARGQPDEAEREFAAALQLSRRVNFARLTTEILSLQADIWRQRGHLAEARAAIDAALQIARERDDSSSIARQLVTLGVIFKLQGDFAEARRAYQEANEVFRATGDSSNRSMVVNNIASIDLTQGHLDDARRALEKQLPEDRRIGVPASIATRLANLSRVLGLQGELAAARTFNAEECRLHETLGAKANLAACRVRLAELWMADGHQAEARAAVGEVTAADLKPGPLAPVDMAKLAGVHLAAGDVKKAAAAIADADRALTGRTIPEQAIPVAITRARVEAALGHGPAAAKILAQARADAERGGFLPLVLEARVAAAQQAGQGMNRAEATVLERDATKAGFGVIAGKARAIAREGLLTDAHGR